MYNHEEEVKKHDAAAYKSRVAVLHAMETLIRNANDERILDSWFVMGVPDGATEEDYEDIAADENMYVETCEEFLRLMQYAPNLYLYWPFLKWADPDSHPNREKDIYGDDQTKPRMAVHFTLCTVDGDVEENLELSLSVKDGMELVRHAHALNDKHRESKEE